MADGLRRAAVPGLAEKIRRLQGPILVLGASGFVGANLMRSLLAVRQDVFGTTHPQAGLAARGPAATSTSGRSTC